MNDNLEAEAGDVVSKSPTVFVHAAELADQMKKQSGGLAGKAGKVIQEHTLATAAIAAAAVDLLCYARNYRRRPKPSSVFAQAK